MAVQANKRKRKHKSIEGKTDDADAAVPKKLPRKDDNFPNGEEDDEYYANAEGEEQNGEGEEENAGGAEFEMKSENGFDEEGATVSNKKPGKARGETKEYKFSKDFKMMQFRTKLRAGGFITELRHFIHLAETKPKMIVKYLEKRGKPLELVEAFERIDKSNVLHVAMLCQALQMLLMEILANQKDHMGSAIQASQYFLKSYGNVLDLLLKSVQPEHRRIALKLMTALVCVEPQLGRQLLNSCELFSDSKSMGQMLFHSKHELEVEETVRKCFIHFVMAFLVEGNTLLVRNILDRGTLIKELINGLNYDDEVTVCLVLSTLKKSVLECTAISKTKKIHIFDLECLKGLARLYQWRGPKFFAFDKKSKNHEAEAEESAALVDSQALKNICETLHDFLILLLTSRKYGIAFDTTSNFRQKHNATQGKLLGTLYQPWANYYKSDLICKVIAACPELARNTMRNYLHVYKTPKCPYRQRIEFLDFIRKFIDTLKPEVYKNTLQHMTLTDLSYWIKDTLLPMDILLELRSPTVAKDEDYHFRLATAKLLLSMFTQYSNFLQAIANREQTKSDNTLRRFKLDLLSHLLLYFPSIEQILISLRFSVRGANLSVSEIHAHMDVVFDILLVVFKEHRSFIDKTNAVLDFLLLLRPLYTDDNTTTVYAKHHNIKLELKAIKTILMIFPRVLEPQQELFASVVTSFIKAFVYGNEDVQQEAGVLLRGIFKNTGIFDSSELEIDLWLESLRFFDNETVDVVTKVFIEVLQVTNAPVDTPNTAEMVTNKESLHKLFDNIEKGLSVQAYLETVSISKMLPLIFKGVEIVEPFKSYLETVVLLMFHYYPTPEYVKNLYEMELEELKPYMMSWLAGKQSPLPLGNDIEKKVPKLNEVEKAILEGNLEFGEIFAAKHEGKSFEFDLEGKAQRLDAVFKNERLLMLYIEKVFFIVAQLTEKQQLKRDQAERAADFLHLLMSVIQFRDEEKEEGDKFLPKVLNYIFVIRLSYIRAVELFNAREETHLNYLHFLRKLIENCKDFKDLETYTVNYRLKMVKAVAICLQNPEETKGFSEKLEESVKCLEAFNLGWENCLEILNSLALGLSYNDLFIEGHEGLRPSIFYDLLVCVLQRLGALKKCVDCKEALKKLSKIYVNIHKKLSLEVNLERFEESLFGFLNVAHQSIPLISSKFFECFFLERRLSKASIKLACLLLERNDKLHQTFLQHLPDHLNKRELIYPLLKVALRKSLDLDSSVLLNVYQDYKNGFMKTIEKPQKAGAIYKENVECSIALIEQCMPKSECVDFTNKTFKFDVVEVYQLRFIHAIYKKALDSLDEEAVKQKSSVFVNFINLIIQMLAVDLKKQLVDQEKLELFAFYLFEWSKKVPSSTDDGLVDYGKILKSPHWMNFCKVCLKLGMHYNEAEALEPQQEKTKAFLLKIMAFLCDQVYADFSEEKGEQHSEPGQMFEMICTHSKFFDILLSHHHHQTEVKAQVLHLLYNLAKKSPSSLAEEQIPVILGAYQARLFDSDRYALALLQLYELHNCGLENYRPFIWGESAIAFYSLKANDEEKAKLTHQETSIAQVMSLIDKQLCDYTLENFPLWRKLNSSLQMPSLDFPDPEKKALTFGSNDLERRIELGFTEFSENDRRFCPKREGLYEQCYDPAFFVPLMNLCFAPEAYAHPARPVQNGLLALTFAALSSQDKDMRLAAASAQLRYRSHFEQNKFFEKPLWIQAYDNIQAGLSHLRESWMKHKRNSGTPRVPFIPCLFIAKTFNISTDPTDLLYKHLTMYLRLKSSFNFETIPEFNILFFSSEVEHTAFRQFILEIIKNGIKTTSDLFLLFSTNTFKVLMGFYGSTMSSLDMNLLILSLFSTCVKIPGSSKIMLENVGLLSWLSGIISSLEFHQFDVIEGVITIISNFWYAFKANSKEFYNIPHISLQIHQLLLQLAPHLSTRISLNCFAKFLNILYKTSSPCQLLAMPPSQLEHLIYCSSKHFPDHIHSIQAIKEFGGIGALDHSSYCKHLFQQGLTLLDIMALSSLRSYTIEWVVSSKVFQEDPLADTSSAELLA